MTRIRRKRFGRGLAGAALTVTLGAGFGAVAWAQDDAVDPPTRVGRIAAIEGNVSFHPSPEDPWAVATVNYPIAQAGQVYADPDSRAELGLGEARIRLDGGAEVDVVQFDDENVVLSVPQGRVDIYLHGRHAEEHYIVETPRGNVDISEDGYYRVFAGSADQPTRVAALHGRAEIAEAQAQLTIHKGEEAVISPSDPPSFEVGTATEDEFDHHGEERERHVTEAVSYRYVSPDMPGAAELDRYGEWHTDAQYGPVWVPAGLPVDWAPYRHGHWASVAPWGWTWIDDAPWGFAPFHYGRWALIGGVWSWVPGEVVVHPVYAPALVTFVGDPGVLIGGGVGIGVSVGWIPLGPREVWVPPYHVSVDYVRASNVAYVPREVVNNITVNNITVIHEKTVFVNQAHVTVVPQRAFASAEPIQRAAVKVEPAAFTRPIVAASAPARILPPPTPAAKLASPAVAVKLPPAATLAIAHPLAPTNNLAKLPPQPAVRPGVPAPQPQARPPEPVQPAVRPGVPAPQPQARPPEPAQPAVRPGVPAPQPQARPPEPVQPAVRPGVPAPQPQARPPEPAQPAARPGVPAPQPQARPPEPAQPAARPGVPAPQPQARPPEPAQPAARPGVPAPQPQARPPEPAQPAARPGVPAPQPQARPPEPPQPAARPGVPALQPQAHPPAPPQPAIRPVVPAPQPTAHPPAPPPPAAHPAAPAPQLQAHPPAPPAPQAHPPAAQPPKPGTPPKKDDKKPNEQQH